MARIPINVGTVADDGTGDKLRDAFLKINQMFAELYGVGAAGYTLPAANTGFLGGVFSSTAPQHQFATGVNTAGGLTYGRPAATDISGLSAVASSGSYADLLSPPTVMTGATSGANGTQGFVPAPSAGQQNSFLRGDGTWAAGSTSAGGSTLQVQYNNAGAFAGMAGTSWNNSTQTLGLTNIQPSGYIGFPATTGAAAGTIQQFVNGAYAPIFHTFSPAGTVSGLNVFIGNGCGNFSLSGTGVQGTQNVGIGVSVMPSLTTGYENMMIGNYCGWQITSGYNNTFMGTESGEQINTGFANTGFGQSTGLVGTTMSNMSFFGATAGGGRTGHSPYTANNSSYFGANADNWSSSALTSASTSAGSNVLTFTAVPLNAAVGMYVCDISSLGKPTLFNIPQGTFVTALTATTLTLSQNVVNTANQTTPAIKSGDLVEVFGEVVTVAANNTTAAGNATLHFANVPSSIVAGMTIYDNTTPSAITYGATPTTVLSVTATTVVMSANATGAGVGNGDSILFLQSQYNYMTVLGAGAIGNRDNTLFYGRNIDTHVFGGIVSGANAPLAQLTILPGLNANLPAMNIGQTTPLTSVNGDVWFDASGYMWNYFKGNKGLLSSTLYVNSGIVLGSSNYLFSATGTNNTLVGQFAGQNLTNGSFNACLGGGTALTSGGSNTLFGYNAGASISTGGPNTCMGANAGAGIIGGANNVCVGLNAGIAIVGGGQNVCIGDIAGNSLTSSSNVIVGFDAGVQITSGGANTIIGSYLNSTGNLSNTLILGAGGNPLITGTSSSMKFGIADAAAPTAITFSVQNVVAGTSNIAGANTTINGSQGTGTGAGGQIKLQTAPAGSTGTSQNALATGLTITAPAVNMQPSVVCGNQALATTATDGFLYIPGGAGPPSGVPTAFTGRVPLYYDETNNQLYIYNSGWKQPKTPAGASIVTWQ